jgi:uncharacterized protein YciI
MRKLFFVLLATILVMVSCNNKKEQAAAKTTPAKYDLDKDSSVYSGEMKRYWLVFLKKGNNRTQDSVTAAGIQAGHIANINRLAKEGKLIMAGPMGTDGDLRGIFIMDAKDSTEIAKLVDTDPAVVAGRLKMEYHPWWCEKGKYIFK